MPLRECAAGAGLQVSLEPARRRLGRELDDDEQRPRTMFESLSRRAVVVPLETVVDIARHTGVVALGIAVALEDVDESSADALHERRRGIVRATGKARGFGNKSDREQ